MKLMRTAMPLIVITALAAGCSSPAATSDAAATTQAVAQSPACHDAMTTVDSIAAQGNIDLSTGAMQASATSGEVDSWAAKLNAAAKDANAYNQGPGTGRQLAGDLTDAGAEAVILGIDVAAATGGSGDQAATGEAHADGRKLITALQKASGDCPQT